MNASNLIDNHIKELADWRGQMMAMLRKVINSSSPELTEDWKWSTPVWVSNGQVCALGAFKDHIKINFFKGASLDDPKSLFNSGFEAKNSRTIDLHEGDKINETALKELILEAINQNKNK